MTGDTAAQVVLLVADGARPDTLATALDAGRLPALARLRDEGALCTVTSVFPSVTGPAYLPFLCGRFPGDAGLPGLRWYDRARARSRSYIGIGIRHIDRDIDAAAPTLFELATPAIASLAMIGRGLHRRDRLGAGAAFALRAARAHFAGDVARWLDIDRSLAARVARRVREGRPRFVFAAFCGVDKTSHAFGHASPETGEALRIVDRAAATVRADAERDGRWSRMQLWVTSDHGHSAVRAHDDLASVLRALGHRPTAHPFTFAGGRDAAVMVSGNAMAHIYLELGRRARPAWPELAARWEPLAASLLERDSVDLLALSRSAAVVEVRGRGRGAATITR